jgi:hypothetical protein
MLFVVDIDCTISDGTQRVKKAGPEPDRANEAQYIVWVQVINSGMEFDQAVPGMVPLITALADKARVIYATSREERHRQTTETWLKVQGFPTAKLLMRPNDCWAATATLKEIMIASNRDSRETVVVIDDDEHGGIEEMCKRNGYTFLKARSGGQIGGNK